MSQTKQALKVAAALQRNPALMSKVLTILIKIAGPWTQAHNSASRRLWTAESGSLIPTTQPVAYIEWDQDAEGTPSTLTPPTGYHWVATDPRNNQTLASGTAASLSEAKTMADYHLTQNGILLAPPGPAND